MSVRVRRAEPEPETEAEKLLADLSVHIREALSTNRRYGAASRDEPERADEVEAEAEAAQVALWKFVYGDLRRALNERDDR